ncbi:hypothetical protein AB7M73_002078 [Bradyrhizobium japonicum]
MIVDPFQLAFERVGRVHRGTQHAKAAGTADGGNDVAAMAEGEQRELDAQHVTDRRFHGSLPAAVALLLLLCLSEGASTLAHRRQRCQSGFGRASCVQTPRGG